MTGIEGTADIATGALIGRAVEPRAGEAHGDGDRGLCLNCGTALIGAHCHACGQAGHVHRTISAIWHDIAHGVFHFDGKMWRTLPLLALHPGELTRRYIAGERALFVSPLAIFLFTVFLMFAVIGNLPGWQFGDGILEPGVTGGMAQAREKLAEEGARAAKSLATNEQKLAKARASREPDRERIAELEQRVIQSRKATNDLATAQRILPAPSASDVADAPVDSEFGWLEANFRHARDNPKLVLYKIKSSAYKFSWVLIPLSLPFVWLMFPFSRRYGLYDHAVFTTYSLTFMSLLAIVLAVLGAIGVPGWMLWTAAGIIPPVHIYKQLKGAYRLGRASGLVRATLLMGMIVTLVVPVFAVSLIYLGVAD